MPEIHDEEASLNPSADKRFGEVAKARVRRRTVLAGGLGTAAAFLAAGTSNAGGPLDDLLDLDIGLGGGRNRGPLLGFTAIGPSQDDEVRVPPGYTATPLVPWGTPILAPFPAFVPGQNSAADQERQMGTDHDGMHFFPMSRGRAGNRRGLLVLNQEAVDEGYLQFGQFTPTLPPATAWTLEMVRKSQAAHGVAVVEIVAENGRWRPVTRSKLNRRITVNTPMEFTGPAAGHRLLRTAADPSGRKVLGTFNNCAHGYTPWGTYLTCEENFNGYFRVDGTGFDAETSALTARYGVGSDRNRWATNDPRFRVAASDPNEPNRHGWVVEIDPFSPRSTPKKRTALGRLKHEGAWVETAKTGQIVVYTGDDQVNEYAYKYVSRRPWRSEVARSRSPLDDGTLYVARFNEDGSGQWLPLIQGEGPLTAANGFADQGDVLIKTRVAASLVGATPMDRPEWFAVNPRTSRVYLTCTNNTSKTGPATKANPRTPNRFGHIVCWEEEDRNFAATSFTWNLLAVAGAGAATGDGSTIEAADAFGSPDGLWSDDEGRLWIQTDGSQPIPCNNQMLAADLANRPAAAPASSDAVPEIRRFLVGPKGCEITGVITTPDSRTMFVNIQHPGEGGGSTWPRLDGLTVPRSSTIVITKDDGGVIGT